MTKPRVNFLPDGSMRPHPRSIKSGSRYDVLDVIERKVGDRCEVKLLVAKYRKSDGAKYLGSKRRDGVITRIGGKPRACWVLLDGETKPQRFAMGQVKTWNHIEPMPKIVVPAVGQRWKPRGAGAVIRIETIEECTGYFRALITFDGQPAALSARYMKTTTIVARYTLLEDT